MRLRKAIVARLALAVVWVFAVEMITTAGGELVRITSPKDGQQTKGRIRVEVQTKVEEPAYVIFCVDGARPHSTNVQPYYFELDTTALTDGSHVLAAEVYSRQGLLGQSAPVTIRVANLPAVSPEPTAVAQQPIAAAEPSRTASESRQAAPKPGLAARDAAADARSSAARPNPPQVLGGALLIGPAAAPAAATQRDEKQPSAQAALPGCPKLRAPSLDAALPVVTVILDGRTLAFDVAPAVCEGKALGALRTLIEQSGGAVNWVAAARQAVAKTMRAQLRVTIGAAQADLDGRVIDLGATVKLQSGRTIVPLRATCEPLGYRVAWTPDSRTVRLCSTEAPVRIGAISAH